MKAKWPNKKLGVLASKVGSGSTPRGGEAVYKPSGTPLIRSKAMILDWDVPVPPLDEQHRILAEIEKLFTRLEAGVAALRRVQANLQRATRLRQAILDKAF